MFKDEPPSTCRIFTRVRHRVSTLDVGDNVLIWVRNGLKRIEGVPRDIVIKANQAVVMPRGIQVDVINQPNGRGAYEAQVFQFGEAAIRSFHQSYAAEYQTTPISGCVAIDVDDQLDAALTRLAERLAGHQNRQLQLHSAVEVLLHLANMGCVVAPRETVTLTDRIRRLVQQRPQHPWTIAGLAHVLGMSQSTLHRRLASTNTTAGDLIRRIRLDVALALLQTSAQPIGEIAQRVGYDSHSKFSVAFRNRFGFLPSLLRDDPAPLKPTRRDDNISAPTT